MKKISLCFFLCCLIYCSNSMDTFPGNSGVIYLVYLENEDCGNCLRTLSDFIRHGQEALPAPLENYVVFFQEEHGPLLYEILNPDNNINIHLILSEKKQFEDYFKIHLESQDFFVIPFFKQAQIEALEIMPSQNISTRKIVELYVRTNLHLQNYHSQ